MKGSGKILMMTAVVTSCLVFYVHLKVSLFHLSYDLNSKSSELAQKGERYRQLKFEVDLLRTPKRLEGMMKELSLDLTLPREIEVMRVRERILPEPLNVTNKTEQASFVGELRGFLNRWVGTAQAKE